MSIVHFTSKREDVPADAVNVRLTTTYRSSTSQEYTRTRLGLPEIPMDAPAGEHPGDLWLYETHVGLCIEDRERNGRDDSDFYMIVWNPEKGAPEQYEYASTRGWSYPSYGSNVDATPEVLEAYTAYLKARDARLREEQAAWLATQPTIDRRVRVVRGRKLPKGTEGEVRWESVRPSRNPFETRAQMNRRIGIKPDGHTAKGYVFVGADQVEVI
jgi:hypothetical protein